MRRETDERSGSGLYIVYNMLYSFSSELNLFDHTIILTISQRILFDNVCIKLPLWSCRLMARFIQQQAKESSRGPEKSENINNAAMLSTAEMT